MATLGAQVCRNFGFGLAQQGLEFRGGAHKCRHQHQGDFKAVVARGLQFGQGLHQERALVAGRHHMPV